MDDFEDIKKVIESDDDDEITNGTMRPSKDMSRITVMGTDPIAKVQSDITEIRAENRELKRIVSELSAKVMTLTIDVSSRRKKTRASVPNKTLFNIKPPDEYTTTTEDADANSVTDSSPAPSMNSRTPATPSEPTNPFSIVSVAGVSTMYKSSSATASRGYTIKQSVWGTGLASLLTAATRYYISKTNSTMMMIDEKLLMTRFNAVVNTLYERAHHKPLPGVRDPSTLYLADLISRMDKDEVPTSCADDWMRSSQHQDGRDVLTVMNTLITMLKLVPEAAPHPVSQIIPNLLVPVVRLYNEKPIFAMRADRDVDLSPDQWERTCLIFKKEALVRYVKYRISGESQVVVVSKMVSEMRASDLVEKKNVEMFNELTPFTMKRRDEIGS